MTLFRRTRAPTVLQLESAECGAASLAMVLGFHGRHEPLESLRALCGVSRDGAKASSLLKAARAFGLEAKGLKAEPEHLRGLRGPMIAFVNFNHFVVVERAARRFVEVNDPAQGRRRIPAAEFAESFTGVVLTFAKGPEFRKGDARPSVAAALRRRLVGFEGALGFVLLVALALVIPGILLPVLSRVFVDYALVRGLADWVPALLAGLAATALVRLLLLDLQGRTLLRVAEAMKLRSGAALMAQLLALPVAFFDQRFAGEVADRLRLDEALADLLAGRLIGALVAAAASLLFGAAMLLVHPLLGAAVTALSLLNVLALRLTTRAVAETMQKVSIDAGKLHGARIAALKDIETFKASGAEELVFARWAGLHAAVVSGRQDAGRVAAWAGAAPGLVGALGQAAALAGGGLLVMRGELTLGGLVAFQSLAASFSGPIATLAGFGAELQELRATTHRLEDIARHKPDPRFERAPEPAERLPAGRVELRGVRFGYAPLDPPLIDGLDLAIEPGRRVALVGASGSGKSTVGKLVAGLETPQAGAVLIDGRAPADWPRDALAARLAYVGQEPAPFEGTARENLTLWDERVEEAALAAAAHDAEAHGFLSARPGGYDARLAEGGADLSGGERQRLELARALARDPALIVMDEATSALDPATEAKVMDAVRRRGATLLVIAHRLSTVRDCDEIVVLERGRPVERGRHEDLIAAGGAYARLLEA